MEELTKFISQVGFPIAVATYMLVRMEKKIGKLTEVIADLKKALDEHTKVILNGGKK